MKRAVVLAILLLVILAGVPMVGSMAMLDCPQCHLSAGHAIGMCLAVLALLVLALPGASARIVWEERILRHLLLGAALERPPRAS